MPSLTDDQRSVLRYYEAEADRREGREGRSNGIPVKLDKFRHARKILTDRGYLEYVNGRYQIVRVAV
jgi:hypothetical protein